jgi:Phospholipase_D-nuclease N-terminal
MTVRRGAAGAGHDGPAAARKRWDELPGWQQAGIVVLSAVEIVLTTMAVADIARRPRARVRGPKALWAAGFSVQPFGPVAYLLLGRRR